MVDLDLVREQTFDRDLFTRERATTVQNVRWIEFFPKTQPKPILIGISLTMLGELGPAAVILGLIVLLTALQITAPLGREWKVAGQLDDDFSRGTVPVDQGIDHAPDLVQRNMNRRVCNFPVTLLCGIGRLPGAECDMALQDRAVIRKVVKNFPVMI